MSRYDYDDDENPLASLVSALRGSPPTPEVMIVQTEDVEGPVTVVRKDYELHNLPRPQIGRVKHAFSEVRDFGSWIKKHGDEKLTEVFIGEHKVICIQNVDESEPHLVTCSLEPHAELVSWLPALGIRLISGEDSWHRAISRSLRGKSADGHDRRITQQEFYQLVRSSGAIFPGTDDGQKQRAMLLESLRKLKATRGTEFAEDLDTAGNLVVLASRGTQNLGSTTPPSEFVISPLAFASCDTIRIEIQVFVNIEIGSSGLRFELSCPGLPSQMLEARRRLVHTIKLSAGDRFFVGLGEGNHGTRAAPLTFTDRIVEEGERIDALTAVVERAVKAAREGKEIRLRGDATEDAGEEVETAEGSA